MRGRTRLDQRALARTQKSEDWHGMAAMWRKGERGGGMVAAELGQIKFGSR
jgi:hypothetical protein